MLLVADKEHTLTCCTHIFLHIAGAHSAHPHACEHTRMAQVCEKGLLHVHVVELHLAFSILMFQPPSLLFPDGHFETTFPTLTSTTFLPSFTCPESAGQAHSRTSTEEFGYLAKSGPLTDTGSFSKKMCSAVPEWLSQPTALDGEYRNTSIHTHVGRTISSHFILLLGELSL